jgi:TadE-like protein
MHTREMRNSGRRGSVIVEASLVLMLFLTIVFTCFDFGFVLFQYQTLVHCARSAARYGVIHPTDTTGMQNIVLYSQPTLPEGKASGDPGIFGLVPSMVAVSRADTGQPEDRICITLSGYRFMFVAPLIAHSFIGNPIQVSLPVEGS